MQGLLVTQALSHWLEHGPNARYTHSVWSAIAALVLLILSCIKGFVLLHPSLILHMTTWKVLILGQLSAGILAAFAFLSLPRKPRVYSDDKPVDAEGTCSAWGRYTFSWAAPTLAMARQNKEIGIGDLPRIPHRLRSGVLLAYMKENWSSKRLWVQVVYLFGSAFLRQLTLSVIVSVTKFGPQYAMFNILRLLEMRLQSADATQVALLWVLALACCMFFNAFVEGWLLWVGWSQIAIPVRALLSILIFTKSIRRKDGKDGQQDDSPAMIDASPSSHDGVAEASEGDVLDKDDRADGSDLKFTQSAGNLVAVDTRRISDFVSLCWFFPASAVRLVMSAWFLYCLIGWASLLAGVLAWSLTVPVNVFVSRRYSGLQGDLMKVRDRKLAAITEALQNIRQIKFAALESEWDARIGEHRSKELALQWKAFLYQMGLLCLLMSGPVLLSTASLITYAFTHLKLMPSVAFTTIAIFGYIEFTLAIIPELVTNAIDAWISVCRIETYMEAPEKGCCVVGSDSFIFADVSVAWPSDSSSPTTDRFILRALNLNFPLGALSVISGKTGSGKSLLLAAILGEAEKLSGTIRTPKVLPSHQFDHHKDPTKSLWIIDSAMAFVAQVPWIENATVKDNILFGLPYTRDRYNRTVTVCALDKDLELFPDGDLTDIGANGINLSGGQRWRISFARALYSRAGILILDDVLSSVDSQVGRQLLEEALAGDLGVGRTRILVTHHVDLCQSQTRYAVRLENGMAETTSLVQGLNQSIKLEGSESTGLTDEDDQIAKRPNGNLVGTDGAIEAASSLVGQGGHVNKGSTERKMFMEDEKRETGKIQLELYKSYMSSAGGLTIWVLVAVFFSGAMGVDLVRVSELILSNPRMQFHRCGSD